MTKQKLENILQNTDITNECRYLVEPRYGGGVFYNIQAEQKTCWQTVCLLIDKEIKTYEKNSVYIVKFKGDVLRVYRKGGMPY